MVRAGRGGRTPKPAEAAEGPSQPDGHTPTASVGHVRWRAACRPRLFAFGGSERQEGAARERKQATATKRRADSAGGTGLPLCQASSPPQTRHCPPCARPHLSESLSPVVSVQPREDDAQAAPVRPLHRVLGEVGEKLRLVDAHNLDAHHLGRGQKALEGRQRGQREAGAGDAVVTHDRVGGVADVLGGLDDGHAQPMTLREKGGGDFLKIAWCVTQ